MNTSTEQPDAKGAKVAQKTQKMHDEQEASREDELSQLVIGCAALAQESLE